ncbi:MAG TPA: hypothetical protein VL242_13455 [Sorangium sp.]|uniref:hypothetical protein n=1 Tax=Sorangium sp. So ce1153 TaxID=3133333 RepID=UPI002C988EC2|nr:hypothetical protein [Sorangium sp.]
MEYKIDCHSMEDARNLAVSKLDELTGGSLGPYVKIVVAKNMGGDSPLAGAEVGVEWGKRGRIRLDFDPVKGPHYNVETRYENWAFCFPYNDHGGTGNAWATLSDEERQAVKEWMQRIGQRRGTR